MLGKKSIHCIASCTLIKMNRRTGNCWCSGLSLPCWIGGLFGNWDLHTKQLINFWLVIAVVHLAEIFHCLHLLSTWPVLVLTKLSANLQEHILLRHLHTTGNQKLMLALGACQPDTSQMLHTVMDPVPCTPAVLGSVCISCQVQGFLSSED